MFCVQLPVVEEVLASWDENFIPSPASSTDNNSPPEEGASTSATCASIGPGAGTSASTETPRRGKKRAGSSGIEHLISLYREDSEEAAAATRRAHKLQKKLVKLQKQADRTQDRIADMMTAYFSRQTNKE